MEVTEDNFLSLLWSYADEKYGEQVRRSYRDCPYDLEFNNNENLTYKHARTWFVLERKNPSGTTVLDEFVDKFVDDALLASNIRQMKELKYGVFAALERPDKYDMLDVRDSNGRTFRLQVTPGASMIGPGWSIQSMVHPWYEDGTYRVTGAVAIFQSERDAPPADPDTDLAGRLPSWFIRRFYADQKKVESITITPESRCDTLLKKLPKGWVDWMFISLKIKKKAVVKKEKIQAISSALTHTRSLRRIIGTLIDEECRALALVVVKGGRIRYGDLCRRTGGDDTPRSQRKDSEVVTTPVGRLRSYGLLVVGRVRISSRTYKMAVIPADVLQCLAALGFDKKD